MAEIFETGSAVLGVAGAAINLFTLIVKIADATRTIRSQINNDALPFRSFRDLIETAEYSIKFRLPSADTDLVAYMHDRNIFWCIQEQSKALYQEIALQIEKIKLLQQKYANESSSYPNRFYAAWRWEKIRKPKLEALHPRMEQLKSTIQLVLAIIQLEVMARNGEASRSPGRTEEIEKLRDLIGKNIKAIEQLRQEFPSVAQIKIGNRRVDSAAEICYLASTVRNKGRVPQLARQLPPQPVSESTRNLDKAPNFSDWPRAELSSETCPRCYQATITPLETTSPLQESPTARQRLGRHFVNLRPSQGWDPQNFRSLRPDGNRQQSSRDHVQRLVPNVRPDGYVPRSPGPQQDTQYGPASETTGAITTLPPGPAPHSNDTSAPEADPEPINPDIIIEPAPVQDILPEHSPEPQPEAKLNRDPTPLHPPSSFPNNLQPSFQASHHSQSPSLDLESDYDLERVPSEDSGNLDPNTPQRNGRRRRAEPLPVVVANVEILNNNGQWHSMPVRLNTSLYVSNSHDDRGREIHYYGIISLRTLIDELGWPEETLLENPNFVVLPNEARFRCDSMHHEGIGRVMLTWRVDQSDDEWANAVVPKMTRECIVSKQDPCEQGVMLKAMPAIQGTRA